MNEITNVTLEAEMDLMLANRQCMKLAEFLGFSAAAQTTFATAVAEISRCAIDHERRTAVLSLGVGKTDSGNYLMAVVKDSTSFISSKSEGYIYARRLLGEVKINNDEAGTSVELRYKVPVNVRVDEEASERMRIMLNTDPEVSPYEEIKRKNKQLLQMAEQLKVGEQKFRDLADSLPIIIHSVNRDGQLMYANRWFFDFTGKSLPGINESRWEDVVHPEDYKRAWENWNHGVEQNRDIFLDYRLKEHATGEYKWHTGVATLVTNDEGNAAHWNVYMVDVDAQKKMQQALKDNKELKETQRALEEKIAELNTSNKQLEQFAYIASHDLQEPLRKISFYSDVLKTRYAGNLSPDSAQVVDNIAGATNRMKTLIHDILAYSTIDKEHTSMKPVDLNEVLAQALQDLEIAVQTKQAIIKYDALPVIEANEPQMKQLFENLISNSLKYTPAGRIPEIRISSVVQHDHVQLSFEDNGIGFETKYLTKIFDLFQRLHTRDKFSGTGIGLAICKKIIQIHKGNITAVSEPRGGATFIVTLPLKQ